MTRATIPSHADELRFRAAYLAELRTARENSIRVQAFLIIGIAVGLLVVTAGPLYFAIGDRGTLASLIDAAIDTFWL